MATVLVSTAYLPSIHLFATLLKSERIIFEKHEHYVKQTYRNRALICGANGLLPLIIPVRHDGLYRQPVHEVKINYGEPWQRIHWKALTSAYRKSPYFEFFENDLKPFYETRMEGLFDFNLRLIETLFSMMDLNLTPSFTDEYQPVPAMPVTDARSSFHPGKRVAGDAEYRQVFGDRFGFVSDLSIVDLLFNKGRDSLNYLAAVNHSLETSSGK